MPDSLLAKSPEVLTAEWLASVLERHASLSAGQVLSVTPTLIGQESGLMSQVVRLSSEYAEAGAVAPASFIVKLAASADSLREDLKPQYDAEVWFYETVAGSLPNVPQCFSATSDPETGHFTLVLEDLGPPLTEDETTCESFEVAEAAVRAAAAIHAPYWQALDPDFLSRLPRYDKSRFQVLATEFSDGWGQIPDFLQMFIPDPVKEVADILPGVLRTRGRLWSAPQTLIHGDFRLANLRFDDAAPPTATAFDWQNVRVGTGALDVAYFLASSLSEERRREWSQVLVASYHDALRKGGVEGYTLEELQDDVAAAFMVNFAIPVADAAFWESVDLTENPGGLMLALTMIGRLADAAVDTREVWSA